MDYSLLVGIHDLKRGNTEGLRDHRLQKIEVINIPLSVSAKLVDMYF